MYENLLLKQQRAGGIIYNKIALGLTREKASEVLEVIPPERIERIESDKFLPHPDEVKIMAQGYKTPHLCNYYCANQCPIGQDYVFGY